MTNKQAYAGLLPCPFCGGEASAEGTVRYSKCPDVWWADGSEVLEAFYVHCVRCGAKRTGIAGGQQTKAEAIEAWNTRPEAAEAISSLLNRAETAETAKENLITAYLRASETKQSLLKRVGELRELLVKHAVHEEFDYPGDAPESCGLWCDICNQHVDDDNPAIGHAETCALNSDAPLSVGEGQ